MKFSKREIEVMAAMIAVATSPDGGYMPTEDEEVAISALNKMKRNT